MTTPDYLHFPTLLALHNALDSLDPAAPPRALPVFPQTVTSSAGRRIAILPGSFNPLHQGHVALAAAAQDTEGADEVWLGLARVTVDKEQTTGALAEDRLVALRHFVQSHPRYGVLLFNRGLYVDQALAARTLWANQVTLQFLVGYDKIVQVFDSRYYEDRDAALCKLFSLASFLVAPRDDATADDLDRLLSRTENQPYANRVRSLNLPRKLAAVSSTSLRVHLGNPADSSGLSALPSPAARLATSTHAYNPPLLLGDALVDRYAVRGALLTALFKDCKWALAHADLPQLLAAALGPTAAGSALRVALLRPADPPLSPGQLRALIQAAQTNAGKQ